MGELGDLLELLHTGPGAVQRLRAEVISTWDGELTHRAWEAHVEDSGGTAYAVLTKDEDVDEPEPSAQERRVKLWVDRGQRLEREESPDALAVRRGTRWWRWDEYSGAVSNDEEEVGTSVAEDARWILIGLPLLALLELETLGRGEVAGRPTRRLRGEPRADEDDWNLHHLPGTGAEAYEIDVDAATGLVLRVEAFFEGSPFNRTEVVDLGVDETFADELFVFASPDGTEPRSVLDTIGRHHHALRPAELEALAPFTVLVPERLPDGWEIDLRFHEGSPRPPMPATAHLHLRESRGLRSVGITQASVDAEGDVDEWDHARPAAWQVEVRDGVSMEWREPAEDWQPTRVRLERDGTRVLIDSTDLTAVELLDLAARLTPLRAGPVAF